MKSLDLAYVDVECFEKSFRSLREKGQRKGLTPIVRRLETFPMMERSGNFREEIEYFLDSAAEVDDNSLPNKTIWVTYVSHSTKSFVVPLYIVGEDMSQCESPYCDHCAVWAGWGNQFVSKTNFHFIIPSFKQLGKPLIHDDKAHLLHGLVHSNGFGHLLGINGFVGGSQTLTGGEVMDFWDRICKSLRVRTISLLDLSIKKGMDLRVLYGLAYGNTWFHKHWNYEVLRGSFGTDISLFKKSLSDLRSSNVDTIVRKVRFFDAQQATNISKIIEFCRNWSDTVISDLKDLFHFMLERAVNVTRNSELPQFLVPNLTAHQVWSMIYNVYYTVVIQYGDMSNQRKISHEMCVAIRNVQRTIHFAKTWPLWDKRTEDGLKFIIKLTLEGMPVCEVISVPQVATIQEVMDAAEATLRGTYIALQYFLVKTIQGLEQVPNTELISEKVESGSVLFVEGTGIGLFCSRMRQCRKE